MKTARLTGRRWLAIRARVFTVNPLCVTCQSKGRVKLAREVDHVVALVNGGSNAIENLQGLCIECHVDKTRQDLGREILAQFDNAGRVIW